MKIVLRALAIAAMTILTGTAVEAATISIAWDRNTEADLAGYVVLYGTASGSYDHSVDVGLQNTWALTVNDTRVYYFRVQAYNRQGARSGYSNEASGSAAAGSSTVPPIGFVDTPLDNTSGVTGTIPFTGWALDDIDMSSVTVCRHAVSGEAPAADGRCGGAAQVYLGSAVFIDGARPDVRAAYPTYPRASRAGWGFMVLTNMLPGQGNGTYAFSVYATDRDNHTVRIGTRTIACANASAVTPFGTIDTPGQGDTVSGSAYVNFGWALTPMPKSIPTNGSTITVVVDGASVGKATYNNYRSDIATLFPGFNNTAGAIGYRRIDTTALTDGLHTIAWSVADSAGSASGIGSRYFTVSNGAGLTAGSQFDLAVVAAATTTTSAALRLDDVNGALLDRNAIVGRRGWNLEAPLRRFLADADGQVTVRSEEIDRLELRLGDNAAGRTYTGYLRTAGALESLPIGSQLDPATGVFTWQPGTGFVGEYAFVFVQLVQGQPVSRREVRIVLNPKGSGHVGPQIAIDTPTSQQDVGRPFTLAGWAIDADADDGSGIETVHVWAYPLSGAAPVFVGSTATGGARPDVAAIYGDRFRASGYGITIDGLAPGNYDLAVFAWSAPQGGFAPAKVVRVTVR